MRYAMSSLPSKPSSPPRRSSTLAVSQPVSARSAASPDPDSMMQLRYRTHGPLVEEGTSFCIFVPRGPLDAATLDDHFPYQGQFHYRVKTSEGGGFCWRDVVSNAVVNVDEKTSVVDVQVLVLALAPVDQSSTSGEDEFAVYYQVMAREARSMDGADSGRGTKDREKENKDKDKGLSMKTLTRGVWNTLLSTAATIQQSLAPSVPLSDEAEEELSVLADKLGSAFSDADPAHLALLARVWGVLFPSRPFERTSATWREAGFQGSDPRADLKQSGLLALECVAFMGTHHAQRTQRMIAAQRPNGPNNYPFAVVAVNLTLLLASVTSLKDQRYLSAQANYWPFFEAPSAFYEMFVACFFHLDHVWTQRRSSRADFSRILGEVKVLISAVLSRAPRSIDEFKYVAQEESMVLT